MSSLASSSLTFSTVVVSLIADDVDGSMKSLGEGVASFCASLGHTVTHLILSKGIRLDTLNSLVRSHLDKMIVVGHSEFFDTTTSFTKRSYHPIPLDKRTIGGFGLEEVTSQFVRILNRVRIQEIHFYCCELATNTRYYEMDSGSECWELTEDFNNEHADSVHRRLIEASSDTSSLEYIAFKIHRETLKCPILKGLNGFGWINPTDTILKTFASSEIALVPTASKIYRGPSATSKSFKKRGRTAPTEVTYAEAVLNKTSPHSIIYTLKARADY